MKNILSIITLIFFTGVLLAQQGLYKKKSVSSLNAVWIKPGAAKNTNVNVKILNDFMKFYVEMPRFNFNQLSKSQVRSFLDKANALDEVSSEKLSEVMESTIIKDIIDILNDPEIQKMRSENFKDESDFESFAATKAKSLSLTSEQLGQLMNSAYIYLPYVTSIKTKQEKNDLEIDMSGGIIWWKLNISSDGSLSVDEVLNAETSSSNVIDLKSKNVITGKTETYDEYSFGDKSYKTTPQTYVQGDAMLAFAKNLNVKTRELSDFKLQAQIIEKDNQSYGFQLGLGDGLHLDDPMFLVEFSEDSEGNEKIDKIGFLRVSKSADNKEDESALSSATQLYGDKGDVGSVVMEHPRLGIDVRLRLGMKSGLNIEPAHFLRWSTSYFDSEPEYLIEETAKSAYVMGLDFSYNLAPIIGVSQTFLDFGFNVGVLKTKLTEFAKDEVWAPFMWDAGMGLSKKIWFGRMSVPIGVAGKWQSITIANTDEESISFSGAGVNANVGFEYMINADIIFHAGVEYNYAMPVSSVTGINSDGNEVDWTDYVDLAHWNEDDSYEYGGTEKALNTGGLSIKVGIDYSLGSLGFDLFGFLDPLKKY